MSDLAAHVQALLRDKLSATEVEVEDESHLHRGHAGARGGGKHLRALVVSAAFEGKSLVQRHRMVNEALAEVLHDGRVHALALMTRTPGEHSRLGAAG
ncbi:MAG: BolA family transcriptional regulator [Deltaproteobacteria bacterium]|nr:BolA family transcriptional regulator [Deltaproteobacteria bacterium]